MSVFSAESLVPFGRAIQRLIQRESLTRGEAYSAFCEVLRNEQPDLQQGAFLAALVAKGETADEIAGAWQAIDELDTVHPPMPAGMEISENSGTGMDALKTFNVSSAAGIVAAACGVRVGRHGARALTSACGSVDILEAVGIGVECDPALVARSIGKAGIGLFNGMSARVHPQALGRILSQIRFGSTLNIAASLANPCRPSFALRGVYLPALIPKVAEVMRQIGYRRALIVHGHDPERQRGMDEISVIGPTTFCELRGTEPVHAGEMVPSDFGLKVRAHADIAPAGDLQKEARRFVAVLAGKGPEACADFVAINAGALLYVAGKAADIQGGLALAREALAQGRALAKLREWAAVQSADPSVAEARLAGLLSGI